jgi:putative ABC transport system permease protein
MSKHGAGTLKIISMLTKEYLKWVFISLIFAIPAWYLIVSKLFSRTVFQTRLSFWIFLLAAVIVLLIAFGTVSWQVYKVSVQNPAKTLKYE